ncbi:hypothetical protein [Mucilaginibacter pedocola]|nr:hypothetical protein [Mucilaginibacter pedocola]
MEDENIFTSEKNVWMRGRFCLMRSRGVRLNFESYGIFSGRKIDNDDFAKLKNEYKAILEQQNEQLQTIDKQLIHFDLNDKP